VKTICTEFTLPRWLDMKIPTERHLRDRTLHNRNVPVTVASALDSYNGFIVVTFTATLAKPNLVRASTNKMEFVMSKRVIPVALLSSLSLITGFAFATGDVYPSNPERSFTQVAPELKPRVEVLKELADFRKNPVTADGWRYVGGEREWAPIPHTFAYVGGKFEHTDVCDHSLSTSLRTVGDRSNQYPDLYKNAG